MTRPNEFGVGVGLLMQITIAPWIWAFHFVICYAAVAVWCEKVSDTDLDGLRFWLIALTGVALLAIAAVGVLGHRKWTRGGYGEDGDIPGIDDVESRERFLGHVSVLLAVISAIGVIYVTLPILLAGTCR